MCKDSQKSVICLTVTHPSNIWRIWIRWPSPGSIYWKQTKVPDCLELFKDSSCSQQDHLHLVLIFVAFSFSSQVQSKSIIPRWWLVSPAQGEQGNSNRFMYWTRGWETWKGKNSSWMCWWLVWHHCATRETSRGTKSEWEYLSKPVNCPVKRSDLQFMDKSHIEKVSLETYFNFHEMFSIHPMDNDKVDL